GPDPRPAGPGRASRPGIRRRPGTLRAGRPAARPGPVARSCRGRAGRVVLGSALLAAHVRPVRRKVCAAAIQAEPALDDLAGLAGGQEAHAYLRSVNATPSLASRSRSAAAWRSSGETPRTSSATLRTSS